MSMPWPVDLGSGTVLWDLGFMKADNDDPDRSPQLTAGTGITVNFSPDVSQAVRYNGVDGNKTIMPLLSQGIINDDGLLCTMSEDGTPDVVGVVLPATDSETMTPRDWTYTVTVLDNRIIINRFSISLATGAEIDLADFAPVDSSGGTHIVTERETALRAERAAGQAETFRDETRTNRQAAQTARTGAETARDQAGTHATNSATSASTAADILAANQALGITVDTSVGTRVFIGDTMIYGDTGWQDITYTLREGFTANSILVKRTEHNVEIIVSALEGHSTNSMTRVFDLPRGFQPRSSGAFPVRDDVYMEASASSGGIFIRTTESRVSTYGILSAQNAWPTSLPTPPALPAPKPPEEFRGLSVLPTPTILLDSDNKLYADLDVNALRPPEGVTYYTSPDASSVTNPDNTGLSPDSPWSVSRILEQDDVGTIIYAPGEYFRNTVSFTTEITKSLNHIASGPGVRVTGWEPPTYLSWQRTSGNIYQTNRSATYSVVDVDNHTGWGDYTVYEQRDDLASITGPGQWAIDGSTVYVWPLGNTDMSVTANRSQLRLQIRARTGVITTGPGRVQYVEGIDFWGASPGAHAYFDGGIAAFNEATIIAKDCTVKYNAVDGVRTRGGHFIGINVEASSNGADGFNYHDSRDVGGEFIEINCHAHHNGLARPGTNNASTSHATVTGIRVNGVYEHAAGPVVADVNRAHTWNIGCYAGGSEGSMVNGQNTSWRTDTTSPENPAIQWLDECVSGEAEYAYRTTGDGATIYVHKSEVRNAAEQWPDSNVLEYLRAIE